MTNPRGVAENEETERDKEAVGPIGPEGSAPNKPEGPAADDKLDQQPMTSQRDQEQEAVGP